MKKLCCLSIVVILLNTVISFAQIYEKSKPPSFHEKVKSFAEIPVVFMPSFDLKALIKEDSIDYNLHIAKPFRFGKNFNVNYSLNNSGLWETLSNGDRIWRLGIKSPGAYSISIVFTEYDIPEGAKVFIYNRDTSNIIGALTSKNNNLMRVLPTTLISGDEIIVEYFVPSNVKNMGKLTIGNVTHDYKGMLKPSNEMVGPYPFDTAAYCEININCPLGQNWQKEKRANPRTAGNGLFGYNRKWGSIYSNYIWAASPVQISDKRYKTNVKPLTSSLNKILKLQGVKYNFKKNYIENDSNRIPSIKKSIDEIGLIAQDVQKIFPEVVAYDSAHDTYGIIYTNLIPALIEAIKEQQGQIDSLKAIVNNDKKLKGAETFDGIAISEVATLDQNLPNPFTSSTVISFNIPQNSKNAAIYIYDLQGLQKKAYLINQRGKSSITVNGSELPAAMYLYSLIIDNKVIDTKRMVLTE